MPDAPRLKVILIFLGLGGAFGGFVLGVLISVSGFLDAVASGDTNPWNDYPYFAWVALGALFGLALGLPPAGLSAFTFLRLPSTPLRPIAVAMLGAAVSATYSIPLRTTTIFAFEPLMLGIAGGASAFCCAIIASVVTRD